MKRLFATLAVTALAISPAAAAPKAIPLQLGSIFTAPVGSEGFTVSGKSAIYLQNANNKSADVVVTAIDLSGQQTWQRVIDGGFDEVGSAITTDPLGNIWIAGATAIAAASETPTSLAGIDNPDGVAIDAPAKLRPDLNQLTLWKISPAGELVGTYLSPQKSVPVVSAMSANNSGVSIIGNIAGTPFLVNAVAGVFGKVVTIGTAKTELNAVARNSDGTTSIFGSSAETLSGKKLAGIRDGILMKVSKTGAVTSLVRSSANKASRSWVSGDAGNFVSGPVITGKVIETAVTKFTPAFAPTWTMRLPSNGPSATLTANGNFYLAFTSKSTVTGIAGWKPTTPSLLVITFDSKGVMKAATALPGLVTPISLAYSPLRGVTGLASSADGTVSIFTLVSR
jgi:hypothetical protein